MDRIDMTKVFAALMGLVSDTSQAAEDRKITVDEALDLVKNTIDNLGLGNVVITDFSKK